MVCLKNMACLPKFEVKAPPRLADDCPTPPANVHVKVKIAYRLCNIDLIKVAPIDKHFLSYVNFRSVGGSERSSAKFQTDDVIVGSTGVKVV